jgi:hypothetical protein
MTWESSRSLTEGACERNWHAKAGRNAQVVIGAIYVRRDRGSKVRAKLLLVRVVRDINETLRMRVPEVALVRRAKVNLVLAQRRFNPVGEHTCRETRDDLAYARDVRRMQHVIVDVDIVAQHRQLILHIHEQAPDYMQNQNQLPPFDE